MTHTKITTAMVLSAGLGKRMQPLTNDRPKPMVELDERPMIDHVLERLETAGIEQCVINLHYQADVLENHLKQRTDRPDILFSDERNELLNTGGGIKHALQLIGDQPFLLHNSDSVWIEGDANNIVNLINAYDPETMDCLMLLAPARASLGYDGKGDFHMSEEGVLSRRAGDEICANVFAGVSIQHPRLFADSPDGAFSINQLWDKAIADGRMHGALFAGRWMHIGTPEALEEAEKAIHIS